MKKTIFALCSAVLVTTFSVAHAQPVADTLPAAHKVASEFIQLIYNVKDSSEVSTTALDSSPKSATIRVTIPSHVCNIQLLKQDGVNKYGWVVQMHNCAAKVK
jgi:hypothetical protein